MSARVLLIGLTCAGFLASAAASPRQGDPGQAAQAFVKYRRGGGTKTSPLPDFYIGAHAEIEQRTLITRDPGRYRTYFPNVLLIAPN